MALLKDDKQEEEQGFFGGLLDKLYQAPGEQMPSGGLLGMDTRDILSASREMAKPRVGLEAIYGGPQNIFDATKMSGAQRRSAPLIAQGQFGQAAQQYESIDPVKQEELAMKQAEYDKFRLEQEEKARRAALMSPKEMAKLSPYELKREEEQAKVDVKARKEWQDLEAGFPSLQSGMKDIEELAKAATFTEAGKVSDYVTRQFGGETYGAQARDLLEAKINQEILPNLKATFGTQLSDKEYDRLRSTLGDPDSPPETKIKVIQSYVQRAKRNLQTKRRKFGFKETQAANVGQAMQVAATQQQAPKKVISRALDMTDPRVQQALDEGYSEDEVKKFMGIK